MQASESVENAPAEPSNPPVDAAQVESPDKPSTEIKVNHPSREACLRLVKSILGPQGRILKNPFGYVIGKKTDKNTFVSLEAGRTLAEVLTAFLIRLLQQTVPVDPPKMVADAGQEALRKAD